MSSSMTATLSLFPATPSLSRAASPALSTRSSPASNTSRRTSACSATTTHTTVSTHPAWPLQYWQSDAPPTFPTHTYESYISFLTSTYPHLAALQTFLFTPPTPRLNPLPITLLDHRSSTHAPIKRTFPFSAPDATLHSVLTRPTPAGVKTRTIIIPYLTPAIVNLLGSHFDLDPDFFLADIPEGVAPMPLSSDPYQRVPLPPGAAAEAVSLYQCAPVAGTAHTTSILLLSVRDAATLPGLARRCSRHQKPRYSEGPVGRERGLCDGLLQGGKEAWEVEGVLEGVVREWAGFLEGVGEEGDWVGWGRALEQVRTVVEVGARRRGGEARRRALARDLEGLEGLCAERRKVEEERKAEEMRREMARIRTVEQEKPSGGIWSFFGCASRRKVRPESTVERAPSLKPSVTSDHRNTKDSGIDMGAGTPWRASWSTIGKAT